MPMTYGVVLCVLVLVTCPHPTLAQWQRMPPECQGTCWETDNEHPLAKCAPGVLDDVVTEAQADVLIASAETYAQSHGWTTKRHVRYPTTDLPTEVLSGETQAIMGGVWTKVEAEVRARCDIGAENKLTINDAFLVKYTAAGQPGLHRHRDGSFASFNLALSTPDVDFQGGGTRVWDSHEVAKNKTYYWNAPRLESEGKQPSVKKKKKRASDAGDARTRLDVPPGGWLHYEPSVSELREEHAVLYRIKKTQMLISGGYHAHEGVGVTKGSRYIVAGFVGMNTHCCSLRYSRWRGVTGVLRVFLLGGDSEQRHKLPLHDWTLYDEFKEEWVLILLTGRAPMAVLGCLVVWRTKIFKLFWKFYTRWRRANRKRSLMPSKSND